MNDENKTVIGQAQTVVDAADSPQQEPKTAMTQSVQPAVDKVAEGEVAEKRKQTIEEATTALAETKKALGALDEQNTAKALDALAVVTGKLELIVARDPQMALAPVDVQTVIHDVFSGTTAIEDMIDEARRALKHGEVQKARHLLSGLASEIVVQTTSIPLATYPQAIKAVAPLIDQGKLDEAKVALQAVLGTVVVSKNSVIPLPVERARAMLKEAASLAENAERTKEESKRLTEMLKDAKKQIELAELLGYGGRKKEFRDIYTQLQEVEKKVASGRSGKGFLDGIVTSFRSLFDHAAETKAEKEAGQNEGDADNAENPVEKDQKSTQSMNT